MTRRFRFFATKDDFIDFFHIAESKKEMQYYKCGNFDNPDGGFVANSMLEYSKLGYCDTGSHIGNHFIVCHKETKLTLRPFKMFTGEIRYSIDQKANPHTIVLDLHGIYQDSAIIVSEIGTLWYENEKAKELFNLFKNSFRKITETNNAGCMIGKNAYQLKETLRFVTIDIKSPIEYDLKF